MKNEGKLPNMDEESRQMHDELKAPPPEHPTPMSDALKEAMPKVRASVDVSAIAKSFEQGVTRIDAEGAARELQENMDKLRELEEKDDCCLLSLQALMLGTKMVTFKFQCPHEVSLFGLRLEYCPKCGKKL